MQMDRLSGLTIKRKRKRCQSKERHGLRSGFSMWEFIKKADTEGKESARHCSHEENKLWCVCNQSGISWAQGLSRWRSVEERVPTSETLSLESTSLLSWS